MEISNDITGDLENTEKLVEEIAETLLKEEEVISYTYPL